MNGDVTFLILREITSLAVTHLVPNSLGPHSHLVPMDKWFQSIWSLKTIGSQDNWSPWTNGPHHIWSLWTNCPKISIIIFSPLMLIKITLRMICIYKHDLISNQRWLSNKLAENIYDFSSYMTIAHPDMSWSLLCIQLNF